MPNSAHHLSALLAAATAMLGAAGYFPAHAQGGPSVTGGFSRPASIRPAAASAGTQSAWVKAHAAAARLVAGAEPTSNGGRRIIAGVEIRLDDGWKTYWRHPGDDGGLPPAFDWAGSRNLKAARVLFPAPQRIKSLNGTTVGYAKGVILPVEIEAVDPALPVELRLVLEYGFCREICVPAEATLGLTVPPGLASMPLDLARSMQLVPVPVAGKAAAEVLRSASANLTGKSPAFTFDVAGNAGAGSVDLLVEAPQGTELPVPVRVGEVVGGAVRFRIDLRHVEGAPGLAGKPLRLTVTGKNGGIELVWIVK